MVASLAISAAVGSIVGPVIIRGLRWLARRTKNRADDRVVDAVANFLAEHPEVISEIAKRIR